MLVCVLLRSYREKVRERSADLGMNPKEGRLGSGWKESAIENGAFSFLRNPWSLGINLSYNLKSNLIHLFFNLDTHAQTEGPQTLKCLAEVKNTAVEDCVLWSHIVVVQLKFVSVFFFLQLILLFSGLWLPSLTRKHYLRNLNSKWFEY